MTAIHCGCAVLTDHGQLSRLYTLDTWTLDSALLIRAAECNRQPRANAVRTLVRFFMSVRKCPLDGVT